MPKMKACEVLGRPEMHLLTMPLFRSLFRFPISLRIIASRLISHRLISALIIPLLLTSLAWTALLSASAASGTSAMPVIGPDLQIASVYGSFEQGSPSSIHVVIRNNAPQSSEPDHPTLDMKSARDIQARLISTDPGISVISQIQNAGLLAAGENTTLHFSALAGGVKKGIYPFLIWLNYTRLARVTQSGEEGGAPGFIFAYDDISSKIPIQAEVLAGPRLELIEPSGLDAWIWRGPTAHPGEESRLELELHNSGDQPALELHLEARPESPFLMVENVNESIGLDPGESAYPVVIVFTDENATAGFYALPCRIRFLEEEEGEGERRSHETAAFVYVESALTPSWLYSGFSSVAIFPLLILLLIAVVAGVAIAIYIKRKLRQYFGGRRRMRIVN